MQKKFTSNLLFLILLNLIIKPFWILGIDRAVQNEVGVYEYGLYFAVFNFSWLFQAILDFGISNFNNRAISRNGSIIQKLLPQIFILKISLSSFYLMVTMIAAFAFNFSNDQKYLLFILCLTQILNSFVLYIRSNISAVQRFKTDAILSILDKALMISIIGSLLWGGISQAPFKINIYVEVQLFCLFITLIVALFLIPGGIKSINFKYNKRLFRKIIRLTMPYALTGLLMAIYFRMDGVMIERMLGFVEGKKQAGIYAASFRLLDAFNVFGFLFASLLLPLFSKGIKQKVDIRKLISVSGIGMYILIASTTMIGFAFSEEIIYLLYPSADHYWVEIFQLLIFAVPGLGMMYIFGTLLLGRGMLKQVNRIAASSFIVNLILNLILIPKYGAKGACYATIFTQTIASLLYFRASMKGTYFNYSMQKFMRVGLWTLFSLALLYYAKYYLINEQGLILTLVFLAMSVVILGFLFGLIRKSDLSE